MEALVKDHNPKLVNGSCSEGHNEENEPQVTFVCKEQFRSPWEYWRKEREERQRKIMLFINNPDKYEIFSKEELRELIDKRIKNFHSKTSPTPKKDPDALNKIIGFMDSAFKSDDEFIEWAEKDE